MQINPYLNFDGDCADAFRFYHRVLGGTLSPLMTYGDAPGCEDLGADSKGKVMHVCLSIGEYSLMGSDSNPQCPYEPVKGMSVALNVSVEDAERIFKAFAEGGTVHMPMEKVFWAERFGALTDRYGTPWLINGGMNPAP